jgi:two-component system, OmpR family, sensor histidine kinase BaeS
MHSITYRITGLVFLLIALTVVGLTYLANLQMTDLFQKYLMGHHMGRMMGPMMMGVPEEAFLASVHRALIWAGLGILLIGLFASYILARSITVPLRRLSIAVEDIAKGNFGRKVAVGTQDEVGHLAIGFNKMTEALAVNNLLRQRLLADIAHELRTPLAVIQGHLEGMLEGVIDSDKEQLSSLYDETTQLSRLIKDLRDLSLAEAGQLALDKKPTDINQLVIHVVQMLKPLADEKNIALETLLEPVPKVLLDTVRINQVLYNLLTNALRYTPTQGNVKVTSSLQTRNGNKWIRIEVKDTGQGIAQQDLPYIFDHFYRADPSRNRKSGGSGIGLAIVKRLIELHGGTIEVKSRLGDGSSFILYLPVIQ